MADRNTEHIKFDTELFKLTALATVATVGGTVGLMLGDLTPMRVFFAGSGWLILGAAVVALVRLQRSIRARIETLKEE